MKTWQKPQLVVLARSNPEEAILTACKRATFGTGSPQVDWTGCGVTFGGGCTACDVITST